MFASPTIDGIERDSEPVKRPNYDSIKTGAQVLKLAADLQLFGHPEGGFYKETDRSQFRMENPYYPGHNKGTEGELLRSGNSGEKPVEVDGKTVTPVRNYSTLIYYLITPESQFGRFHKNHSRIIHILQKGRGQYVLIYPDGKVKSFKVGFDFENGEVAQWVVPGEVYKASFLLPLKDSKEDENDCLLISEVVVPGFEFEDHTFMETEQELVQLVGEDRSKELKWLLGP